MFYNFINIYRYHSDHKKGKLGKQDRYHYLHRTRKVSRTHRKVPRTRDNCLLIPTYHLRTTTSYRALNRWY